MGQQDVECRFYDNHFESCICDHNFISRFKILSHTTSLCLEKDIFLLDYPTLLSFRGVNDIFISNHPLERYFEDILQFD
jgi:hypothetical protein